MIGTSTRWCRPCPVDSVNRPLSESPCPLSEEIAGNRHRDNSTWRAKESDHVSGHRLRFPHALDVQGTCEQRNRAARPDGVRPAFGSFVKAFAPDYIIQFAPDHFNGFFYDLMPSFTVGAGAVSLGDWGGGTGPLDVPGADGA